AQRQVGVPAQMVLDLRRFGLRDERAALEAGGGESAPDDRRVGEIVALDPVGGEERPHRLGLLAGAVCGQQRAKRLDGGGGKNLRNLHRDAVLAGPAGGVLAHVLELDRRRELVTGRFAQAPEGDGQEARPGTSALLDAAELRGGEIAVGASEVVEEVERLVGHARRSSGRAGCRQAARRTGPPGLGPRAWARRCEREPILNGLEQVCRATYSQHCAEDLPRLPPHLVRWPRLS